MSKTMSEFLTENGAYERASFHMPGHKGRLLYRQGCIPDRMEELIKWDITEVPGADNLFQAEGIIRDIQSRYARLYQSKRSWILINGSSCGIIASILASVARGKKLIMARNCHKSAFHALAMGGLQPVYAYPELVEEYGISGAVPPLEIDRLLQENPDAEAVILPSPNYYGICSDIRKIAEIVHHYGKILIVDQAHGAHLKFFEQYATDRGMLPLSAETAGADLVINSTHKTLASFTQSAVLNLQSSRVDPAALEERLQWMQSTSPSYLLMASMDLNAKLLQEEGETRIHRWEEDLKEFYRKAEGVSGLSVMNTGGNMDLTKINLDFSALEITGAELEKKLLSAGIVPELVTGNIVMCMTGIGNQRSDYELLIQTLREIACEGEKSIRNVNQRYANSSKLAGFQPGEIFPVPEEKRRTKLNEAAGKICASSIIPYPPGIPLVCPGEKLTAEMIGYIQELRRMGEKVIGILEEEEIFTD